MKKIRVAVIGGGHLGQIHTRLLKSNLHASLVAVCDPQPLVQQKFIQQFDVRAVSDFRKILPDIDAAVVATPTSLHHAVAKELLSHGIHLLIEKPVTNDAEQARELVELAKTNKCIVQVGHVERFNPAIQVALKAVGQPRYIEAERLSGYTYRSTDIGVVHDLMIHDIDLASWIFGSPVIETRSVGMSVMGDHEDMAQSRLQFACGAVANLTASRCSYQPRRVLRLFGPAGFANVDLTANKVEVVQVPTWIGQREFDFKSANTEQQAFVREQLFHSILPKTEIVVEPANAIALEHQDWLKAIGTNRQPLVSLEQAAIAIDIAERILEQIKSHSWLAGQRQTIGPFAIFDPKQIAPSPIPASLSGNSVRRQAA